LVNEPILCHPNQPRLPSQLLVPPVAHLLLEEGEGPTPEGRQDPLEVGHLVVGHQVEAAVEGRELLVPTPPALLLQLRLHLRPRSSLQA